MIRLPYEAVVMALEPIYDKIINNKIDCQNEQDISDHYDLVGAMIESCGWDRDEFAREYLSNVFTDICKKYPPSKNILLDGYSKQEII